VGWWEYFFEDSEDLSRRRLEEERDRLFTVSMVLLSFVILSIPFLTTSIAYMQGGQGFYTPVFDARIELHLESWQKSQSVSMHELGHSYFDNELTEQEQERFVEASQGSDVYITSYAEKSPDEDFAEMFAATHTCQANRFDVEGFDLERKYEVFNDLVNGSEWYDEPRRYSFVTTR